MTSDDRFFAWLRRAVALRVGEDDIDSWCYVLWLDHGTCEWCVRLFRPADEGYPRMEVLGRAYDVLSLRHWKGWNIYKAAARALRALG